MADVAARPSETIDGRKRQFIATSSIFGFVFIALSVRAQTLGRGEWFTVGIAGDLSRPKLLEGQLIAIDSKVWPIQRVGAFFSHTSQDNLEVPEAFTFRWRAKGDAQVQERVIRVRSRLPRDVVEKLASNASPPYAITLNFRVQDGAPDIKWSFSRLDRGNSRRAGGAHLLAEGVIAGDPQK